MNKTEILERLPDEETICGYRYTLDGLEERVELAVIPTEELVERPLGLYWVGPSSGDYKCLYRYEDYGVTWAFDKSELPIDVA